MFLTFKISKYIKAIPVLKILCCIFIAIISFIIWKCIKKLFKYYASKSSNGSILTMSRVVLGVVRAIIFIICVLVILQICGVNVTSAVAGLGIAGAIVGLALQDILKDLIMGIHIMSDNFFKIGDVVIYEGEEAMVSEFSMKTTKLTLLSDCSIIAICNRDIEKIRRLKSILEFTIPIPYSEKFERVYLVISQISESIKKIEYVDDCKYCGAQNFEASSISHKLWIYCQPTERYNVRIKAIEITIQELEKAGISIPYNQLDVHIDK